MKKKNILDIVLLILSITSYGIAFVFFALALTNWAGMGLTSSGSVFGNIFGSVDVSSYIVSFINIVSLFFTSIIFLLAGMALQLIRKR